MTERKHSSELLPDAVKSIEDYTSDTARDDESKAAKVLYWIRDYIRFLRKEATYDPKKGIAYKRGCIVKVQFGFRIGNEFGGMHYAVVISKDNPKTSGILTVIPLISKREGRTVHWTSVDIGTEFFRKVISKHDKLSKELEEKRSTALAEIDKTETAHRKEDGSLSAIHADELAKLNELITQFEKQLKQLHELRNEITRMKEGSVALTSQITTISKVRIYDPQRATHSLAGIKLEPATLGIIDEKIKELFVYEKT